MFFKSIYSLFMVFMTFSVLADNPTVVYPGAPDGYKKLVVPALSSYPKDSVFTLQLKKRTAQGCNASTHFTGQMIKKYVPSSNIYYFKLEQIEGPFHSNDVSSCLLTGQEVAFPIRTNIGHLKGLYPTYFYLPTDIEATYTVWTITTGETKLLSSQEQTECVSFTSSCRENLPHCYGGVYLKRYGEVIKTFYNYDYMLRDSIDIPGEEDPFTHMNAMKECQAEQRLLTE